MAITQYHYSSDVDSDGILYHPSTTNTQTSAVQIGGEKLKKLKSMREEVDWENIKERQSFFHKFRFLIVGWKDNLPNLYDLFEREEIEWMLVECVKGGAMIMDSLSFIDFVLRTGYKDKPELDEYGKPLLCRTTPVHYVYEHFKEYERDLLICPLFEIYNSFYVNYISDDGFTHFHVACRLSHHEVVHEFLLFGQDPNEQMIIFKEDSAYTPLHLAIQSNNGKKVIQLLLEYGADPNKPSKDGITLLHVICKEIHRDEICLDILETLLENGDLEHLPDNLGQTPLQLAFLNRLPKMIDALLDCGADLSSFVFPSEDDFKKVIKNLNGFKAGNRFELACGTLAAVESLENRGYKLDQSDAITIMKFLIDHLLFNRSEPINNDTDDESWRDDESFIRMAKMIRIKADDPSLTLYDLTRLPPKESENPLTYQDYFNLSRSQFLKSFYGIMPERMFNACSAYLFEKMSAGFFRQWTLGPFMKMTRQRNPELELSKLFCIKVLEKKKNEDLLKICKHVMHYYEVYSTKI